MERIKIYQFFAFFSRILISSVQLEVEKSRNGFGKIRSIRYNHLAWRGSFRSGCFDSCQDRLQSCYCFITAICNGKWTWWRWAMLTRLVELFLTPLRSFICLVQTLGTDFKLFPVNGMSWNLAGLWCSWFSFKV